LIVKSHLAEQDTSEKQRGVAQWVFDRQQSAGWGTDSLPSEDALYLPLVGARGSVGVISVRPRGLEKLSDPQRRLLDSFTHQIAQALEVDRAGLEAETERLRSSLLSSVSHDFRTPLTAIVGSASALIDKEEIRKGPKGLELLHIIQSEGERLARLVQNLLETTRLESRQVRLKKELYPLEEILGSALERLKKQLQGRKVKIAIPSDLPAVPADGMLLEQVFINLFDNAVRHAPNGSIDVSASLGPDRVTVSVADQGPGLNEEEMERVFDKFFHGKTSGGAGLGLAICRAIVNAHGGRIWAENAKKGGAVFNFTLPLKDTSEQ
jgi:two-component system sensor histidine kinase KdpD